MNKHALRLMEFDKVLTKLAAYCFSDQGRQLLASCGIKTEPADVNHLKSFTTAFKKLLLDVAKFPELSFPDISPYYNRLEIRGAFLEPAELLDLGNYLVNATRLRRHIVKHSQADCLLGITREIPDLGQVTREIFKVVDRNGNVKDGKIPELVKIKKELLRLKEGVDAAARQWLSGTTYKSYWQTDMATTRNGRILLPLKANFKGRIKGIVHETSGSGATVYIEPFDLVEKNNAVIHCENSYRNELIKILQQVTARITEVFPQVKQTAEQVSLLDTFYARAVFSLRYNCHPAFHTNKKILLKQARHPLLTGKPVPLDLVLADDVRVLIITGPNTGGKTVCLKTVALLAMMNQFGMEIPAAEGSSLPVFDNILADIGDEQSIEQSLSTFSGHIRNLSRIIEGCTADSLVLLDELGAGTDPEEGVAIAMALLDHFIARGSMVLASTHHGILKNYGYTRQGVENASMDFDDKSLTPRYSLIIGFPGESHALAIAARNGIPAAIIAKAQSYLDDERSDISELIRRLAEKQKKLRQYELEHTKKATELKEKQRLTDLKELRLRQKELEVTEYSLKELKRFLLTSRKELENMIRSLREEELTRQRIKEVHDYLGSIETKIRSQEEKLERTTQIQYLPPGIKLKPGMQVIVKSSRKSGEILRKAKGNTWVVKTGSLKVTLAVHELEPVVIDQSAENVEVITSHSQSNTQPVFTLNLIGERLNDALASLEKQLDAAVINGLREFNIIHGKGDGILQRGIHDYLKNSPFVDDYFFSTPESGGFGRTIVVLKG